MTSVVKQITTTLTNNQQQYVRSQLQSLFRSFRCASITTTTNFTKNDQILVRKQRLHLHATFTTSSARVFSSQTAVELHRQPQASDGHHNKNNNNNNTDATYYMEDGFLMMRPPKLPIAPPEKHEYPLRRFRMRTCAGVFNSMNRKGFRVPAHGIDVDVSMVDTGAHPYFFTNHRGERSPVPSPIVLFLHDTPGSHEDFGACIKMFAQCGARVLAPNFPGFGHSHLDPLGFFNNDPVVRSIFIGDLLNRLQINRLDMIVAQGNASAVAIPLASNFNLPTRALCLINPLPMRPPASLRPFYLTYKLVHMLWRLHFTRPYAKFFMRNGALSDYIDPLRLFPDTVCRESIVNGYGGVIYHSYKRQLLEAPFAAIDLLFLMSADHPLFSRKDLLNVGKILGMPEERVAVVNERNEMYRVGAPSVTERRYVKGVCFDRGGKAPQLTQPRFVQSMLLDQYNFMCRKFGMRLRMTETANNSNDTFTMPLNRRERSGAWADREAKVVRKSFQQQKQALAAA